MTQYFFPPDPRDHWSDQLAAEVGRQWSKQRRLRWLWLRLQQRLKGPPRQSGLEPGEGRAPGLLEPELDEEESARILRNWLFLCAAETRDRRRQAIKRYREKQRQEQQRLMERGITPLQLEEMRREQANRERDARFVDTGIAVVAWLLRGNGLHEKRQMDSHWLQAPSVPAVFLRVRSLPMHVVEELDDGDVIHSTLVGPDCLVEVHRREPSGGLVLMHRYEAFSEDVLRMWRRRRRLGWRVAQPPR
jgi:hypothetical protein